MQASSQQRRGSQHHYERELGVPALNNGPGAVNDSLAYDQKARDVDEHGQHDQWQTPSPVGTPHERVVINEDAASGLGNSHRDLLSRSLGRDESPLPSLLLWRRPKTQRGFEVFETAGGLLQT